MKKTCPKCGYEWETKTDKEPKACPLCKQYLKREEIMKNKEGRK
ncbi:MAG: hypothetical protein WC332_00380 [Clostridia bacterium]|jgi:rubrerythrin